MNEQTNINVEKLRPFTRILMTIGELPTSYLMSMTYLEQVTWFCNYLQKTVIPVVNNNAQAVEELQNIIDNLNLQDEVDTKLDEMAESGQLTDIIAQYLDLAGVLTFDNIGDMSDATNIVAGSTCYCLGKNTYNDGDGAFYKIRQVTTGDIIDGYLIVAIQYDNTLIAERLLSKVIQKKYLFIGDSYTEGYTPDGSVTTFPELFRQRMGLSTNQVQVAYHGGYGFGRDGYKFESIIQGLSNDDEITDVIILGGYNDRGQTYSNIYNGIETCKNLVNTKFKNATLHIGQVGCSNNSATTYSLYGVSTSYRNACQTLHIKYIHNIEYVLHKYFLDFSSDGFHPNQNGHSDLAYAIENYFTNNYLNLKIPFVGMTASNEENFTLPTTLDQRLTCTLTNNNTFISNKNLIIMQVNNINMNGNNTLYRIGTLTGGLIIGSTYYVNSIPLTFIVKTNGVYKNVPGVIFFENGGIYISFVSINDAGNNYALYNNVTEIQIPPFSATFTSDLS